MGKVKVDTKDVGTFGRLLSRGMRELERRLNQAMRDVGGDAELAFAAYALRSTSRLARGIRARVVGDTVVVGATAVNPRSGYDYVSVTRFGHRVSRIYPVNARALGPIPGIGFRRSVRGYRPAGDWRDRALPTVEYEAGRRMEALGRSFSVRFV